MAPVKAEPASKHQKVMLSQELATNKIAQERLECKGLLALLLVLILLQQH